MAIDNPCRRGTSGKLGVMGFKRLQEASRDEFPITEVYAISIAEFVLKYHLACRLFHTAA
jgi:hypothetical protein